MTAPGTQHPLALLETLRKQSETLLRDTHDVGQRSYGAGMRCVLDELEPVAAAEAGLREALVRVEHLSAKAVADDVEGYYTNEMGRIARAALAQAGGEG